MLFRLVLALLLSLGLALLLAWGWNRSDPATDPHMASAATAPLIPAR